MIIVSILAILAYLEIVLLIMFLSKRLKLSNSLACPLALLWPVSLPIVVWSLAKYVGPMLSLISVLEPSSGEDTPEEG